MKVLKAPDLSAWKKPVNCGTCKAALEIVLEDLRGDDSPYPSGTYGDDITLVFKDCTCMICGSTIRVPVDVSVWVPWVHQKNKQSSYQR